MTLRETYKKLGISIALTKLAVLLVASCCLMLLVACSCSSATVSGFASNASDSLPQVSSLGNSEPEETDNHSSLLYDAKTIYNEGMSAISAFVERRMSAIPHHYEIGEMAAATDNLAVGVLSIESGPYDYRDKSSTTKVTVAMVNVSSKTVIVKASNWNADTVEGLRVDHKYAVYSKDGSKTAESFTVAKVSPEATYVAELYFDGSLIDVLYEPHWLVSSQNEYLYWDVG